MQIKSVQNTRYIEKDLDLTFDLELLDLLGLDLDFGKLILLAFGLFSLKI